MTESKIMKTRVTELLGISYSVIQGGMAHIAEYHLASAVSEAGGLGVIASANGSAERVKKEIEALRERTDRPFGVNIILLSPHAAEVAQMAAEEKVPVITTDAGNPEKYMSLWKSAGIKVIPVVASVALAKRMERCGADAVIAEGCEAGGHIGELTSMTLIPQIADEVEIPVIGAGGVGDGRGLAAMLILGAEGVQVGTRFVVAEESIAHENYKQKILKARDIDSVVTGRSCGHPIRSVRNPHTRKYIEMEKSGASFEELEYLALGSLRRAVEEGDLENGNFMAGQIAGLIHKEQPCREILEELVTEAEALLGGSKPWER